MEQKMADFTVSTAAQLTAAVAAARGGDTIYLAPGTYADLTIQNRTFSAPVVITSLDPNNPARIGTTNIINSDYVTFRSVHMGFALAPDQPSWAKMVTVRDSSYIWFEKISMYGSLDNNPRNDADGLAVFNSDYIRVFQSEFQQVRRAVAMGNSNHVEVLESNFHDIRQGGTLFAESHNVRVSGNRFSNFSISPDDHPDAIQFWETGTTRNSRDVVIMDNIIMQGNGNAMQGIVFGNSKPEYKYENITIANNLVYVSTFNGILVDGASGFRVEGNSVMSPRGDNVLTRIYVLNSDNGAIRYNVAEIMLTADTNNNVGVRQSDNWNLSREPTRAAQIRDLEAGAAATVEGLVVPSIGYRIPSMPNPVDAPIYGTAGRDGWYLGKTFDPTDRIDGFGERDQVAIQGHYQMVMGPDNLVGVESLALMSGADARFGDTANNLYHYDITSIDANVAAGATLTVNGANLRAGESMRFDGSAERDGNFIVHAGRARDTIITGAGADGIFFGDGCFTPGDTVDGGAGRDQVAFRGDYSAGFAFLADTVRNVESIAVMSGWDTRFGNWTSSLSYNLTLHDGNVAAGQQMTVNAANLHAGETLTFNGSAELDGSFRVLGGAGADIVIGSANGDLIYGAAGADRIIGGGGADIFQYRAISDSAGLAYDCLVRFDCTVDRIDLPGDRGGLTDLVSAGRLSAGSFAADLTAALEGILGVGDAALFTPDQGDLAGRIFLVVDANGRAGYQSGEDFLLELEAPAQPIPLGSDFFI
jgi:Ca2+-binding RTX toxin-like protein